MTRNGKQPLSLEELMRKKEQEEREKARPVFLSKKQREELALQRRREEVERQRQMMEELRREREREEEEEREQELARRRRRDNAREERERERELELMKKQYLGEEDKHQRKARRAGDRMRFVFDWSQDEDTTLEGGLLHQNGHEAMLLFGRGMRGGIDRREQKKNSVKVETEAIKRARKMQGRLETGEDAERAEARRRRANVYDAGDMRVDTHWTMKKRTEMTERDWRIFREDFNISFKGATSGAALPIRNWDEAELPSEIRKSIVDAGYKKPSPIQMASIPLGIQQRDVIGVAETGSGKTAAFVIPMLMYIQRQPVMAGNPDIESEGPYAVVLAPTRELAQQIEVETKKLAKYTRYRVVAVVGGQSIEDQGFALRKGCEIVVATPGRLVDCLERQYAVLNQCNYVVLDEADRMIDMGFEPQVMGVLDAMPSSNLKPENEDETLEKNKVYRTTYMFSATMPPAVEKLARKYLRRPVIVNIGAAGKATDNVTQRVLMMKENEKANVLEQELALNGDSKVIIFANTHRKVDMVAKMVQDLGYSATLLHGGKTQDQREDNIKGFREGYYTILVATDVAGRGIDVPDVMLVVNYDMPNSIEAYTHRIGRTGRAGRKGDAVSFLTMGDTDIFYDLRKFLEESGALVPDKLKSHEASRIKPGALDGPKPAIQFAKK